mmetsp:Transcript_294/g.610  ORF Transcript_294/g.610 Transcript_294/m.610 type:complete len:201 (-) Transcript_294:283-885(-)
MVSRSGLEGTRGTEGHQAGGWRASGTERDGTLYALTITRAATACGALETEHGAALAAMRRRGRCSHVTSLSIARRPRRFVHSVRWKCLESEPGRDWGTRVGLRHITLLGGKCVRQQAAARSWSLGGVARWVRVAVAAQLRKPTMAIHTYIIRYSTSPLPLQLPDVAHETAPSLGGKTRPTHVLHPNTTNRSACTRLGDWR